MPQVPSFTPRERGPKVGPLQLPAAGREGDPPRWPLPGRHTAVEREAWAQLWRTPQAVAWEQLGWARTVARYCRVMVRAERPGSAAAIQAQATALEDRLGLTPKAMRLLLWTIGPAPSAEQPEAAPTDELEEARRRLRPSG